MNKSLTLIGILIFSTVSFGFAGLADKAETWENRYYQKGVSARCAAWVGAVVTQSGGTPPSGYYKCTSWLRYGKSVPTSTMRRDDIVIYTSNGKHHHIAIYVGNGKVIHRPTKSKTVRKMSVNYRPILSVRRSSHSSSLDGGFSFLKKLFKTVDTD